MDRRNFLTTITAITGSAALAPQVSLSGTSEKKGKIHQLDKARYHVVTSSNQCIFDAEICNIHCLSLLKDGDDSLAECQSTVDAVITACTAVTQLAYQNSSHLKSMMKVCIDICKDCEEECRKHEHHHAECKKCADSCADCIASYKKFLG